MWRQAGQFQGNSQVSTWLLAITRNMALSVLRRRTMEELDESAAEAGIHITDAEMAKWIEDNFKTTSNYVDYVSSFHVSRLEFEAVLRKIRYRNGEPAWRERNHYFADWCRSNIGNGVCRPVEVAGSVKLNKSSDSEPGLGRRSWTLDVIPPAMLLASSSKFIAGDIVGFVSRRTNLDYFHTGFVAFGGKGELLLRHASSTRRRVIDEPMTRFLAVNGVKSAVWPAPRRTPV